MTGSILSLDLGTLTGFAISTTDGLAVFASGSRSFHLTRFDGGGVRWLRFKHFLNELNESAGPFAEIVYEQVRRHMSTDSAHAYGGFQAHLSEWAEKREIPYSSVGVGVWKKAVVGHGNASKAEIIHAMVERGFNPVDDNEADALAILLYRLANP